MTLDSKSSELVAIGASIVANCQPCVKYHIKIAKDSGATEDEIRDAIETAGMVKARSGSFMSKFVEEILNGDGKSQEHPQEKKASEVNRACCG